MLRRHVLAALARGIAADDEDAARAALARIDPVLRRPARRRLERALIDAQLLVAGQGAPAEAPGNALRLAALAVAGAPIPAAPGDAAAVAAAHAALPPAAAPRGPTWTLAAALVAVAAAATVAVAVLRRPPPPSRTWTPPRPPPSARAFAEGGVPLHDPALDGLWARDLTDAVVALGAAAEAGRGDVDAALAPLAASPAMASRGQVVRGAWRDLLDQLGAAVAACAAARAGDVARATGGAPGAPGTIDAAVAPALRDAARGLSAALAAEGLGYVVEGRIHDGFPLVQAYRVEEVAWVRTGGTARRVLSLARADRLATAYGVLGLHSEGLTDPVLMLERIDELVAGELLPGLVPAAPYPLAEHAWAVTPTGARLVAAIGDAVRGELAAALGADAGRAATIAARLAERRDLLDEWQASLARRHLRMVRPDELFLPDGMLAQLADLVPRFQRQRVGAIEDELAAAEAPRIAARLRELVAASVRRHEAQHGDDAERAPPRPYPAALQALLGPRVDEAGAEVPVARAAAAELSAYLAQLASDPVTPHLDLWHLARQAFTEDRFGTGEMFAAYVVLEGLARHLPGAPAPVGRGRARLAPLALALAAQPGPALRAAAAALWTELYGEAFVPITP